MLVINVRNVNTLFFIFIFFMHTNKKYSSIISNDLFKSARADYFEVLMTQRDALESKLELIETKLHQFNSVTNIYRALGGGWN